jgi:hypothetical protein
MRNLITAIARLLGVQTQPSETPAQPTPTAGPARQVRTRKAGNKPSAQTTKPRRQSKSATKKLSSKPKAAQSTKAASSPKAVKKSAPAARGQSGKQPATPARRTRQHAK